MIASEATRPWWKSRLVLLAGCCLVFIYLFVRFASEVTELETGTFDVAVRHWVMGHRPPALRAIFQLFTWLGGWVSLVVGALIVGLVLARHGARMRPLLVAVAPFVLSLIVWVVKGWYRVGRPPAGLASALTFSFPSGHTSASTAVAVVIAYVVTREGVAGRWVWPLAIGFALAVGVSRIVLDMHWASDVLGGWMIGASYAAIVCALYERAHVREHLRAGSDADPARQSD